MIDKSSPRQVNVVRSLANNPTGQRYHSVAVLKAMVVGYREDASGLDRARPVVFGITQTDAVCQRVAGKWKDVEVPAENPLRGRPLGAVEPIREFRIRWTAAFDLLLRDAKVGKSFRISQGCVVEKMDGSRFQLRNFKTGEPWMAADRFENINRVHRSPLAATARQG
jgi:hypothetical protein